MSHRSPQIGLDQVDDLGDGRGKALDQQLEIHENGADPGAGQQVVHVVVGPGEVNHLGLQFVVDRGLVTADGVKPIKAVNGSHHLIADPNQKIGHISTDRPAVVDSENNGLVCPIARYYGCIIVHTCCYRNPVKKT